MRSGDGAFAFVPEEHLDDPAAARESVRDLMEHEIDLLCPAHGQPTSSGGTQAMRDALER